MPLTGTMLASLRESSPVLVLVLVLVFSFVFVLVFSSFLHPIGCVLLSRLAGGYNAYGSTWRLQPVAVGSGKS